MDVTVLPCHVTINLFLLINTKLIKTYQIIRFFKIPSKYKPINTADHRDPTQGVARCGDYVASTAVLPVAFCMHEDVQ